MSSMVSGVRIGATSRNFVCIFLKPVTPDAASVRMGPALTALTRMPVRAQVAREVADAGLEGRLGDAHHVVVRHDLLGAVVRHRQDRAAVAHQRARLTSHRDERVRRDVVREQEALARGAG